MKDKFDDGTYEIIGAAMEVHKKLGPGFLEAVYQAAFAMELSERGIPFEREIDIPVAYKGKQTNKHYRVDFICGDKMVELKALKQLSGLERAIMINYLKNSAYQVGLLFNFGGISLEYERFVDTKKRK